MKKQNYDIPLHDIKPLLEVDDYSFYYFLGALSVLIILLIGIIYLVYKYFKKRNAYNKRKEYINNINNLDINDTKKTAYQISFYGELFKDDSPRHAEMFQNLTQRLESYKYKKTVDKFDKETIGYIDLYKEMLDV